MKKLWQLRNRISPTIVGGLMTLTVFLLALLPRVLNLDTFITYDEYDQLSFAAQFLQSVAAHDWGNALVLGYPGVPTMALGALGIWLQAQWGGLAHSLPSIFTSPSPASISPSVSLSHHIFLPLVQKQSPAGEPFDQIAATITSHPLQYLGAARLPLVVVSAVMVTIIFLLLSRLTGRKIAFAAAVLMSFNPLFLALSKIIHVDAPLAYFMFASFTAFVLYLKKGNYGILALSGLFGALAILSKTPAIILGGILLFTGIIFLLLTAPEAKRQIQRRVLVAFIGWSVVALVSFFIFWPAMWTRPLFALNWIFQNIIQNNQQTRSGSGVFWGYFNSDRNPFYYLYAFPFRWTPLTTIGVVASIGLTIEGMRSYHKNIEKFASRMLPLVISLQAYVVIFIAAISIVSRRSVRYSLPAMFPLELLAVLGMIWLLQKVSILNRKWQITIISVAIIVQMLSVAQYHPYYYTYFNPLLGGYRTAPKLVNMGLGEGLDAAARYLNQLPNAENETTAAWFHRQFEPYYNGKTVQIFDTQEVVHADHTVFYITQLQLGFPTEELLNYFADRQPEKVIRLGGIDYVWIYPGPIIGRDEPKDISLPLGTALNDQLILRGMNIAPPSSGKIPVTLYWLPLDTLPADLNVSLQLVDSAGEVWGQIDRLPIGGLVRTQKWQPGDTVRDEYLLPVDPAIPPGEYTFNVQMYDFTTGDVFGQVKRVGQVTITPPEKPLLQLNDGKQGQSVRLTDGLVLLDDTFTHFETLPGYHTTFKLYWRAEKSLPADMTVSLMARAANGGDIPLATMPIGAKDYPPDRWRRGEIIGQTADIRIPADMPPGEYSLVATVNGAATVTLGKISVRAQSHTFDLPAAAVPTAARFGDAIALAGYTITKNDDGLDLTLYWRADRPPDDDLKVFVHITDVAGNIIAQRDRLPADGARPTLTWVAGEIIADHYHFPPDAAGHTVWTGLYNPLTGKRLPVTGGNLPVSDNRLQIVNDK